MQARTRAAALAMACTLVLLGACSSSDAADKPADEATEQTSGGDVDVNAKDGTVKYTDEDGNQTEMNIDGSGASLPKGWPADLAPPDSVTIITSRTSTDGKEVTILGEAESSIDDLAAPIRDQVTGAGYTITQDTSSDVSGGGYAGMTAAKGDAELTVAISSDTTSKGKVTITMTLTSKS